MAASQEQRNLIIDSVEGSCHCKAVQFTVKDVDLSKVTKCNCSVCVKDGSTMTKVSGDSLILHDIDGTSAVFDYKDNLDGRDSQMRNTNLSTYRFNLDNPDIMIFRHFCNHCGIPVFVTAYAGGHGGAIASININSLDLEKVGIDRSQITRPENMVYIEGKENLFKSQTGKPWPHGAW